MTSSFHQNNSKSRFKSLDEFTVLEKIGSGGYSSVLLVENKKTGRRYAMKQAMRFKKGKDRSDRTMTEIKILKKLKHKNVITLKGWFEDEENIYLILEYIPGRDCSKFFKNKLPTKSQVRSIMRQLIDAVYYCHSQGVVHRDIKLDNILIDDKLNIKLTDFGLSTIKSNQFDMLGGVLGTVKYTSPEMLEGNGYNDSIDVWSLGITLFALLTGKYPFDGSTKSRIFKRIKEKTIHYSKYDLEKKEIRLLRMLLEKDPEKRIEIEEILEQPFFN